MEPIESFRRALEDGKTCIGTAVALRDPQVSDILADSSDFLWMETEHSHISPEALTGHLFAAHAKGKPLFVRVTDCASPFFKPLLDTGADGIVIPFVQSAQDVRRAVGACRYPPLGYRGYGPIKAAGYGAGGKEYIEWANRNIFTAVVIETAQALNELDAILAVPGLDSIVIGPYDLSFSLGVTGDVNSPVLLRAVDTIIEKSRAAGISVGCGMYPDPEYAAKMTAKGVQWLLLWSDFYMLHEYSRNITSEIRRRVGDIKIED